MSCVVRKANLDDLPVIMKQLKDFSDFYKSKQSLYGKDEVFSHNLISGFIKEQVFFVAESEGEILGFIVGMVLPHVYNPGITTLTELFWWVKEEARGGRAGLKLLNAFVDYGKENVDWIICTIEDDSPVNEKSFLKRGFRFKEKSFLMEVR